MTDPIDQGQALQALRLEIDRLDQELLTLLNRRAECALEVAAVKEKSANNEPAIFYRPEREAQVLRGLVDQNLGPLSHEKVTLIFRQIMSACLSRTVRHLYPASNAEAFWRGGHWSALSDGR